MSDNFIPVFRDGSDGSMWQTEPGEFTRVLTGEVDGRTRFVRVSDVVDYFTAAVVLIAVFKHCKVVHYPGNNEYPIEHDAAAGKDNRDAISDALLKRIFQQ